MSKEKISYLLFCSECGVPQEIPHYIIEMYFIEGMDGVYCENCENQTAIPDYLKKLKNDL